MRPYMLIVVLLLMTTLTGCIQKYEYSEEQTDATAEYIAGLMLKNDKEYKASLLPMEGLIVKNETPAPEVITPTPVGSTNTGSGQSNNQPTPTVTPLDYTLTEVIGEKGFEFEYKDYIITESYPEDASNAYFSITPRDGYQLIVLNFNLKNTLNKDNRLNLTKAEIEYQLDVNLGTIYVPPFALLENNLKLIDITLKAQEEKSMVLIFEIKKDTTLNDINLMVSRDNRSEIIEIK